MANNKSNTKVIKIAPEVDKQASNKTKEDIKKLSKDLEFQFTTLGKSLSEKGIGGLNKSSNESVKNIIKNFKELHPALQKQVKVGYGEIAKFFNSIQKDFIKANDGVEKQFVKNLKSMIKETKSAVKELDKESARMRQSRQQLYESLFPQADRAYNLKILRQRKARQDQQQLYESLFREADLNRYRSRNRVLPNLQSSRIARESSGFSKWFSEVETISNVKNRYVSGQLEKRRQEVFSKLFDEALSKERAKILRQDQQQLYESLFPQADRAYNLNILRQRKQNELIGASINRNTEKYDLMNKEKYYQDVFSEGNLISYYANINKKHREGFERMMEPGNKVLQDFSRRVKIYFSYKAIDLFTNSITGAVDSLVKLQSAFANIQAITASTNGQMEKIRKSVFDVGVNTRFATEEIADAAVVLGQAGLSTKEISSVLEHTATLASATGEDLKNTAGLMTSVLSIWNMNADQASHVADVFVTSANDTKATLDSLSYGVQYAGTSLAQLGVSFEETSAVMAASTNAGLKSSSMLGTGMRALATELTNQSKRMQDTLASLGLTFDDVDIQSLGLIKVLKNLKEAGFGATEAFAAFDRRAATYALAALSELDTAEKLTDAFNQNGAAAKANATQMATLESQLISLRDIVAKDLSTTFRVITGFFTKLLTGINEFLKAWDGFFGKIIVSTTAIIGFTTAFRGLSAVFKKTKDFFTGYLALKEMNTKVDVFTKAMIKLGIVQQKNALSARLLKLAFGGLAITLGTMAFEWWLKNFKSLEDQIAELNETMETHKSTINSVASDLEELANKEGLYSDDVEILNKRIAELNKKYSDKGFVVQYAEANEDLSEKLKMVREELEAIDRIENKRRANAGYEAAKKTLELTKENASRTDSYWGNLGKSQLESFADIARLNVFKQVDETLKSNDAEKYTLAKNKVLSEYSIYKNQFKNNEEWKKLLDRDIDSINEYISAHFNFVEAEIDKKAAEFDNSKEALDLGDKLDAVVQQETEFLKEQLDEIMKATTENGGKNLAKVKTSDVSEKMKNISEYINGTFLKQLQDIESQIPEEFRSKSKVGSSTSTITNKIGRGTYAPSELSNLLKILDSWRNESKFGKEVSANADRLYNVINEYMLSQIKNQGALTDKQKLRQAQVAAEAANRTRKLNKTESESRSNPFLDLRRNELSNIGESTKAAKKARDIRLKGFGYTTGLTSTAQGLYKGYSDEMSLLESARNTERYAKILKELETKYKSLFNAYKSGTIDRENLSKVEVTALDLMKDTENKLIESSEAYQILTGKTYEYGASLADLNIKYADLTMKTEELTSASTTGWNGFLEGFKNKYKEMSEQVRKNGSISNQIGELVYTSGISSMENALISICDRTKSVSDAFREMLADILKEIRNFLIKQAVKQFFMILGSSITSAGFSGTVSTTNGTTSLTNSAGQGVTSASGSQTVNPIVRPNMGIKFSAAGGVVQGGIKGRDSVHTMLMPGEYVIKKSAVDVLGTKFFNSLNTNAAQTMNTVGAMMGGASMEYQGEPSVVNVWVVSEKDEAQMGPNDVIATISKDLQTGGTTKKLIQTIVAGRKA